MKKYIIFFYVCLGLNSCIPGIQDVQLRQESKEIADQVEMMVSTFNSIFTDLDITIHHIEAYNYQGDDLNTFNKAINQFYHKNVNFCPLKEAFYTNSQPGVYLTLTGNAGNDIRGFVYDLSQRPRLLYGYIEGYTSTNIEKTSCITQNAQ